MYNKGFGPVSRRNNKGNRYRLPIVVGILAVAFVAVAASVINSRTIPIQTAPSADSSTVSSKPANTSKSSSETSSAVPSSSAVESTVSAQQPVKTVSLKEADKPLWVKVDLAGQKVTVYDASDRVVQNYVCSTGLPGSDTPTGTFTVKERGKSFFSRQYQEGAYYWTQFKGDFLFHSIPFDKNEVIEEQEAKKLGTKASHGCVRLAIDNAKWIYDNIPRGTKVVIE